MIEVVVNDLMPNDIIALVHDIKEQGHIMGTDFSFQYKPPMFDVYSGDAVYNRYVIFTFYKEELATWFSLKYL